MRGVTNIGIVNNDRLTVNGDVAGTINKGRRPAGSVDVLILTALREEYEAAKEAVPTAWQEHDGRTSAPYVTGSLAGLSVALARATGIGARNIASLATTLVLRLRPRCLAMSGVCAGDPAWTAPGDVVVADPAYEYDEGKHTGGRFLGDHRHYPQDTRWLRAVQEFDPTGLPSHGEATEEETMVWLLERLYRGQDARKHPARSRYFPRGTWSTRLHTLEEDGFIVWRDSDWALTGTGIAMIERLLADDVDGPRTLPFAVLAGPMASGSAVIENPGIWAQLKDMGERRVLALEMEAATIATVAHDNQVPHWLVAKGVMDGANPEKDDRFKHFAARASAEVLYALLTRVMSDATTGPAMPGRIKVEVCRELHYDWQDVADAVGVPSFEQRRFRTGDEPRALWEWLEDRGRLGELAAALDTIGRADVAALLRSAGDE
jgi:nucleoside phosphorylase